MDDPLHESADSTLSMGATSARALSTQFLPAPDLQFAPGTLLLDRFRIIRAIGSGGMGTVYLATDEKLGQPRAIKIAKTGHARHLPPEAATALRVTHPNVCRVHEIHTLETPDGPVDFLSMEFVDGETLASHLACHGPLAPAEALPIALQICAGLAAAHAVRLLHRDLKSANILLDCTVQPIQRAVITDFGLAQDQDLSTSAATGCAGTPAYLAPERWAGGRASQATDIFALGLVLHEIYTGSRPDPGPGDPRTATRLVSPSIPALIRAVITRCLEPDPQHRFPSAEAVAAALAPPPMPHRRPSPYWAALLLLLLAIPLYRWLSPVTPAARLAIFPIEGRNLSADAAELLRGASFDLSHRLTGYRPRPVQLVVIPIEETRAIPTANPAIARARLGATHILRATITPAPDGRFHLEAQILDTSTGLPLREYRSNFTATTLPFALPEALTATVAAAFHLPSAAAAESVSPAAASAYATANSLLRTDASRGAAAAAVFEQAIALDPASSLPRAGFAEAAFNAWRSTQDATWLIRGREQLAQAIERSPDSLSVHLAAGKLSLAPGAYERAREEFLRATQIDPNSAEAWRGLALAYESMTGHENEAATAYLKASQVQPSYYAPLTDLCLFYRRVGQYSQAIGYCRQVTALAPALLQGHLNLGGVLTEAGRFADSELELRLALNIDPKSRPVLNNLAAVYQYLGRDSDAVASLRLARAAGPDSTVLMLNLGDSHRRLGQLSEAQSAYRRGLELTRAATSQNSRDAAARAYLAYFLIRLNQTKPGRLELEQALALDERDKTVLRRAILCFVALGDNARAISLLRSAPPDLVHELERQPDLLEFRKDPAVRALAQPSTPTQ